MHLSKATFVTIRPAGSSVFTTSLASMLRIVAVFMLSTLTGATMAAESSPSSNTIVLVHGAFADGSSWSKVIPLLQAKGLHVVAVQNPLTSLADDVAATKRVIDMQTGHVILVGHSWGGVVITEAGNNDKVAALVYVSAFAPDSGQSINDIIGKFPPAPYQATMSRDERGFLYLSPEAVAQYFAPDQSPETQKVMAATQAPWFYGCLADKVSNAAWHAKPSWWVLSTKDQILDPQLQQAMASAAKSTITHVSSSHVAMLSKPAEVAAVIVAAANSVK